MLTERDYQELYDRLLEEVGALHRANQRRIRSGMWALLAVTVGLMILMFLAGGNKVFTLVLWILSMFAVAAYLIAVEYMDYELQKKLRSIAQLEESAFDGLMNVPELPAAPELPRLLRRRAAARSLPEDAASPEEPAPEAAPVPPETPAVPETPAAPETPSAPETPAAPQEPAAPAEEPAAQQPAPEESAAPRGVSLPQGWEHVLEDPARLADDLTLLTRALQNLSEDLRRAGDKKEGER